MLLIPSRVCISRAALLACAVVLAAGLIAGCAGGEGFGRARQTVTDWARECGFEAERREAGRFRLLVLRRPGRIAESAVLRVYIEGDGAAWPTRFRPPRDPTPTRPVALELAAADTEGSVAYLSRPCQYLDAAELAACAPEYWTSARFSAEVVDAYQQALDDLVSVSGARRLRLVGYSGGGVLAALLAARREDVVQLVTVAAPLRVAAWTAHHGLTPLQGLDPDMLDGRWPSAVHFAGDKDDVVPADIVAPHARRTGARLAVIPGFDHHCCWARDWPRLLEETR